VPLRYPRSASELRSGEKISIFFVCPIQPVNSTDLSTARESALDPANWAVFVHNASLTEETIPTPIEAYGKAKLTGENLCREYARNGLDVTIVRPRTIVGQGRLGIFQILFEWIYQGKSIPVLGDGKNIYQFVHADDLAEACIQASIVTGADAFNCGTDRFRTMREVLEHLCRHAGTGSQVKSLPMWPIVAATNLSSRMGISPLGAYHA